MFSVDYPYEDCEVAAEFIDFGADFRGGARQGLPRHGATPVALVSAGPGRVPAEDAQARTLWKTPDAETIGHGAARAPMDKRTRARQSTAQGGAKTPNATQIDWGRT